MADAVYQVGPAASSTHAHYYPDWHAAMQDAVTDPDELCSLLSLPPEVAASAARAVNQFALLVPRTYLARIRPTDPNDPLLLQILPKGEEADNVAGFTSDPVGELHAAQDAGWLCKYTGRLLMLTNAACAVHCRFCFRRHFPFSGEDPAKRWEAALERIASDAAIHEVILSGGDPLTLEDALLAELAQRIAAIGHVRRLRIHTRLPIVIPQRVCDELLEWLSGGRLTAVMVVHVNHPAELDGPTSAALGRLVDAGVPVYSQSVLLCGVNDQVEVLADLFERLADLRVKVYYLHQLDRVAGGAHFEVPVERGIAIMRELQARLPGYAVPRYVKEIPGRPNKVVLA